MCGWIRHVTFVVGYLLPGGFYCRQFALVDRLHVRLYHVRHLAPSQRFSLVHLAPCILVNFLSQQVQPLNKLPPQIPILQTIQRLYFILLPRRPHQRHTVPIPKQRQQRLLHLVRIPVPRIRRLLSQAVLQILSRCNASAPLVPQL